MGRVARRGRIAGIARCLVVCWVVWVCGCGPIPPTQPEPDPEPPAGFTPGVPVVGLLVNDFYVNVSWQGILFEGAWQDRPVIFLAGLWVGTRQQGVPRANIVWVGTSPSSNYTTQWDSVHAGVYLVTAERLRDPEFHWPEAYGAPMDAQGNRVLYGDAMAWSALQGDPTHTTPLLADAVRNLRVTQAVFGYDRADLRNVLFIRYDLKNFGAALLEETYVGFYSDTDLYFSSKNSTTFDLDRGLSITYAEKDTVRNAFFVSGYAFLETPGPVGPSHGVAAHRVMRKNIHPLYGEENLTSATQALYVLQGLANDGTPMVDPVTGQTTPYAFTGDPVAGTGWVDIQVDVRGVISSGPFALQQDETGVVSVVWVVERGATFQEALNRIKSKVDQIRGETALWQF